MACPYLYLCNIARQQDQMWNPDVDAITSTEALFSRIEEMNNLKLKTLILGGDDSSFHNDENELLVIIPSNPKP